MKRVFGDRKAATLVHVTHAKAGSTWIRNLLRELFRTRVTERGRLVASGTGGDLSKHYFSPGKIYPAMFMTREQFLAHPELKNVNRFVVIRDLRDTFVSLYFSLKVSHPPMEDGHIAIERDKLQGLTEEEGLLSLIERRGRRVAAIQTSWLNANELVLRYEDIVKNPQGVFEELFLRKLGLPLSRSKLARAVRKVSFETVFRRKLGVEDVKSHGRRGLPGDWRNHFTPKIRERFAERYGEILIATGYENDSAWIKG